MSQPANLPNLELKTTQSLAFIYNETSVQTFINNFLTRTTEENYNMMIPALQASITSLLQPYNIRVLVIIADGTVAFDSFRPNNTWDNFLNKTINENHNTRPEILQALLSSNGIGTSYRRIASPTVDLSYAIRFGLSVTYPLGFYKLSQTV